MLELGEMGKVHCEITRSGLWRAQCRYRGAGGFIKTIKRTGNTKEEAVTRLHAACAEAGGSSWMKLPPPQPVLPEQTTGPREPRPPKRHSVYRFFDADGNLLYVGISADPRRRLGEHRGRPSTWWWETSNITLDHYPSFEDARWAEKVAIETENPRYNRGDGYTQAEAARDRLRKQLGIT